MKSLSKFLLCIGIMCIVIGTILNQCKFQKKDVAEVTKESITVVTETTTIPVETETIPRIRQWPPETTTQKMTIIKAEISKQIIQSVTTTKLPEIATQKDNTEKSSNIMNYIKKYDMTYTAYCPCLSCSEGYGRGTALGYQIPVGTKAVAVDRNQIPLGSIVYVVIPGGEDYGYAYACDVGGAITHNRIDLFIEDHSGPFYNKGKCEVYLIETDVTPEEWESFER